MSLFDVLRVSVGGLVPFRRCNWLHSRGMSAGILHHICLRDGWSLSLGATRMLLMVVWGLPSGTHDRSHIQAVSKSRIWTVKNPNVA